MKKNKKKQLPLLLIALLLISFGAYGTQAYFTDQNSHDGALELKLGDIQMSTNDLGWKYKFEENSTNFNTNLNDNKDGTFTNVRPGDSFERIIKIENKGKLDQIININEKLRDSAKGLFKIEIKNYDLIDKKVLKAGASKDMLITVTIDTENDYQFNKGEIDGNKVNTNELNDGNILNLFGKNLTISARQTNDSSKN